jgi:hypothetical protein
MAGIRRRREKEREREREGRERKEREREREQWKEVQLIKTEACRSSKTKQKEGLPNNMFKVGQLNFTHKTH